MMHAFEYCQNNRRVSFRRVDASQYVLGWNPCILNASGLNYSSFPFPCSYCCCSDLLASSIWLIWVHYCFWKLDFWFIAFPVREILLSSFGGGQSFANASAHSDDISLTVFHRQIIAVIYCVRNLRNAWARSPQGQFQISGLLFLK